MSIGYSWYMVLKEVHDRTFVSRDELKTILSRFRLPESTKKVMTEKRLLEGAKRDSDNFPQGYVLGPSASNAMEEYEREQQSAKKSTKTMRAAWWAVGISIGSLLVSVSNSGWFHQLVSLISK